MAAAPESFQMLVGSAATLYESLRHGAVGAVIAVADAFPELCVEIYQAAGQGNAERARALQEKLIAPGKVLGPQYGIPGLKYAMDRLGYYGGPARPPLMRLSDAARREIDAMLAGMSLAETVQQS